MMKKILIVSLLILSLLSLSVFGVAEEAASPIRMLFDAEKSLLFDTSNVTMTGQADIWLDNALIKEAELTHIQDGIRSMRDWQLYTPAFGYESEFDSGYTVITFDDTIMAYEYSRPDPTPLQYIVDPAIQRTGILRKTVAGDALLDLAGMILSQNDSFGETSIEPNEDGSQQIYIQISEEDVPEVIQSLLNNVLLYGIDRYSMHDYSITDLYNEAHYTSFNAAYAGFIYCLKSIRLTDLSIDARLDPQGRLLYMSCGAYFTYTERNNDYTGTLRAELEQGATDYGTSAVSDSPATYSRWGK